MANYTEPTQIQDLDNAKAAGQTYIYAVAWDPTTNPTSAFAGTLAVGVGKDAAVKGKCWQKQDDGLSSNWTLFGSGGGGGSISPSVIVYVDPTNGNDSTGDGTIAKPYKTGAKAVSTITDATALKPYLIKIYPGVVTGSINLKPFVSLEGSGSDNTTIAGGITLYLTHNETGYTKISNIYIEHETNIGMTGANPWHIFMSDVECDLLTYEKGTSSSLLYINDSTIYESGGIHATLYAFSCEFAESMFINDNSLINLYSSKIWPNSASIEFGDNIIFKTIGCDVEGAHLIFGSGNTWKTDASSMKCVYTGTPTLVYLDVASEMGNDSSVTGATIKNALDWLKANASATAGSLSFPFSFSDVSPKTLLNLPINTIILRTHIKIINAFNGTAPLLSVGIAGNTGRFMATTENDPKIIDSYDNSNNDVLDAASDIILTINPDSSSVGTGLVIIEIEKA